MNNYIRARWFNKSSFCVCRSVEPMVSLDVTAHDLLNCRAGTTIRIPATITGRPIPKVTWTFDGTAETEKKNELHTLPIDSEVRTLTLTHSFSYCTKFYS